jgi:peptidoglycan/xylan/chitin deacetylase (PgdA/CDA1 family)
MSNDSSVYLMYHELGVPGRELCLPDPGYLRYVVTEASFREQLALLREMGLRGLSVGEAIDLSKDSARGVAITFDDGSESDLIVAAPALKEMGFNATFYVVHDFLGQRGYLSQSQVRELSDLGFEIGSHSMTHKYLSGVGPDVLQREIVESKHKLEQVLGRRVDHFACPGGRWNRDVSRIAEDAGYRSVATSRIAANPSPPDRMRLARVVIMRGTSAGEFVDLCAGRGLFARQARVALLDAAKGALGNSVYERVRTALLG